MPAATRVSRNGPNGWSFTVFSAPSRPCAFSGSACHAATRKKKPTMTSAMPLAMYPTALP